MRIERIFLAGFITAIAFLAFVAGVASMRYQLPPGTLVNKGLREAALWLDRPDRAIYPPTSPHSPEYNVANAKIAWDKERTYGDYTLISLRYATSAWLVDMDGKIVHRWDMPFKKAWPTPTHINDFMNANIFLETAHAFPNGDLLAQYSGIDDTPYGYGIVKMDKDSNVLWTYNANAHHDFYIDPQDGSIYALTHAFVNEAPPGLEGLPYPMLTDDIVHLSPDGRETNRISIAEAFRGSPFEHLLYTPRSRGNEKWDFLHTNAIRKLEPEMADAFPMFKAGQLLISIRNISALAVIDPGTRKVVWASQGGWHWQHAPDFLPNGHILVLDNLGHIFNNTAYTRAIEFDPKTLQVAWSFAGNPQNPISSDGYGRVQRFPNGNTFILDAMHAHAIEVTAQGNIVWDYSLPRTKSDKLSLYAITTATRYRENQLPFLKDSQ